MNSFKLLKCMTITLTLIIGVKVISHGQNLEISSTDPGSRDLLTMSFPINNNLSSSRMVLKAGEGGQESFGDLQTWGLSYSGLAGYAGKAGVTNSQNGLVLRADGNSGQIQFLTGGFDVIANNRLNISADGKIGIATPAPLEQLHLQTGNIYLQEVGSGIILKSPNGSCFRLSVSDTGTAVFSNLTCP